MWTVVVPLKRLADAKTRLGLPPPLRRALAVAMVSDVLAAVRQVAPVRVLSADPDAGRFGLPLIPDPGGGLCAAVAAGARAVPGRVAVIAGDLPALRPAELAAALDAARAVDLAVVADAAGLGTTMLAAARGSALRPAYGPGSRRRHVRAGAHDLTDSLAVPGLRHDVDTVADLRRALALGVGRHTERAVDRAFAGGLSDVRSDLDRRPPVWTPSGSHSW